MIALLSWLLVATAQQEVCQPYSPPRWQAEMEAAQQALDAVRIDRARAILDEVHRQLRCLDQVAQAGDLAQHARLLAQRSMFDMDPLGFEEWIRLAQHLEPEGVWPVPAEHPLWRFIGQVPTAELRVVPDRWPAHPKRGGVFLDGVFLERAELLADVPHLLQVFDETGARVHTAWVDGAMLPEVWLTDTPTLASAPRWWTHAVGDDDDLDRSWPAARKDTAEAYADYLAKNPLGEHAAEARRRLDDRLWDAAEAVGTVEAAGDYVTRFPAGRHASEAEAALAADAFRRALHAGTAEALQRVLVAHPRGLVATEVKARLDAMAWRQAVQANTATAYARYRIQWPKGRFEREARLAHADRAFDELSEVPSPTALRAYLDAWPQSLRLPDVRAALAVADARSASLTLEVPDDWDGAESLHPTLVDLGAHRGTTFVEMPDLIGDPKHPAMWHVTVSRAPGRLEARVELSVPAFDRPVRIETVELVTLPDDDRAAGEQLARYISDAIWGP